MFEYAPVFLLGSTESFKSLFVMFNSIVHSFRAQGSSRLPVLIGTETRTLALSRQVRGRNSKILKGSVPTCTIINHFKFREQFSGHGNSAIQVIQCVVQSFCGMAHDASGPSLIWCRQLVPGATMIVSAGAERMAGKSTSSAARRWNPARPGRIMGGGALIVLCLRLGYRSLAFQRLVSALDSIVLALDFV
jgi:hypothetical protein